jgi:hypothetical protein
MSWAGFETPSPAVSVTISGFALLRYRAPRHAYLRRGLALVSPATCLRTRRQTDPSIPDR